MGYSLLVCVLYAAVVWYLTQNNTAVYQFLYLYQIEKIKQTHDAEVLFIGDSSLGNAVDQAEYTRLSGKKTLNVALTGNFGYAGSYNMLKTAHRRHPDLRHVFLMQTLDMQTRETAYDGYVRTARHPFDFLELSWRDKRIFVERFRKYVAGIQRKKDSVWGLVHSDYIKQGEKKDFTETAETFLCEKINPEKNLFLQKIVEYCAAEKLQLIYLHGPLLTDIARRSAAYKTCAEEKISATGIRLDTTLIRLTNARTGDSEDHVLPELKQDFTEKYYRLTERYLAD